MNKKTLRLGIVGGLGMMSSPMARHWLPDSENYSPARVLVVHDRGNIGANRDDARKLWHKHGAQLVGEISVLASLSELDGIIVCAGKNGDDLGIIAECVSKISAVGTRKFICHMSTVSAQFVRAASSFASSKGVDYVNYPLTGGVLGAQNGTLLILAGGNIETYEVLKPALDRLGTPRFIGDSILAGAEAKLIGHLLVFNGFMGISSGIALHCEAFQNGKWGGIQQSDFFDFLNLGAGGTRQWDVSLKSAVSADDLNQGFSLKYAVVDAIYTAQLCLERRLANLCVEAVVNTALLFSYALNNRGFELATQASARELLSDRAKDVNDFVSRYSAPRGDMELAIERLVESLPAKLQQSVLLHVTLQSFQQKVY